MTWREEQDIPAPRDGSTFEVQTDHEDEKAMKSYRQAIIDDTLKMTGLQVRERLSRIDAEIKRIGELQAQLVRLKRITKAAVLSVQGEDN